MNRAPSTVTRPRCRSAVARTIARPRPEPASSARARQNRSKACSASARREPRPLVRDAEPDEIGAVLDGDMDAPARGAVAPRVLDEVRDRSLERRRLTAHGRRLDGQVDVRRGERPRELVEPDLLVGRKRSLLAGEREQVVRKPCEPVGIGLEIVDQLRRRAVACQVRDVAAKCGQRRPQLVRCVGEEAALGVARALEAREHRVERRREPADLVAARGLGEALPRVARALDLARRAGEPGKRLERASHQQGNGDRTDRGGGEPGEQREHMQRADRLGDVGRRRADDHGAASGRAGDVGDRRGVGPEVVAVERDAAERGDAVAHRPVSERDGKRATAQRERPGDDAAVAVDDLDHRLRGADRRVERAGCRQQGGRGCRELCDLHRARAQRVVLRAVQVPGDEHVDRRAEHDHRDERRKCGRDGRAQAKAHRPRTNPTPRTVSISAGSPSFRRRFETYRSTTFACASPSQIWETACSRVTTRRE